MKSKSTLPILSLALLFASCTTAYKSGQTPDDVYYSPARPAAEYVSQERQDDRRYGYDDQEAYRDDRYLRMKIRDPRYDGLYDDYYSYNPYYYHYYNGSLLYNTPWTSYSYWNYYYNPYCSHVYTVVPAPIHKLPSYNHPRTFDLSVYTPQDNSHNPKAKSRNTYNSYSAPSRTSNNYQNSGRDAGSYLRNVFSGSSGSNSGNTNSVRTSSPSSYPSSSPSSSSSSSSSGSSSGSSAPSRGNATRGGH